MDIEERNLRILYGQHLTNLTNQIQVCKDVNGIQAQLILNAVHALKIRTTKWS